MTSKAKMVEVWIRYPESHDIGPVSITTSNAEMVAEFMAKNLSGWCLDDEVEIIINGKRVPQ